MRPESSQPAAMKLPSTAWRESVEPDEAARFDTYAARFVALQAAKSAKYGTGRTLHRKGLLALRAELEVLADLPEAARHGLFAAPRKLPVVIRLSNGGADRAPDRRPDVRGFALRVSGLDGESALGGPADAQCFLLINHSAFSFPRSEEFMDLALAGGRGPGALIWHLLRRYGLLGAVEKLGQLKRTFGKPFRGFASEPFFSAAPIACGPYAARVRLSPEAPNPAPAEGTDWAADVRARLAKGPLAFSLALQFFVDEATTPIEDASVDWPVSAAPYVPVARLVVPAQSFDDADAKALGDATERGVFDPWVALAAHRPLGNVMRARKVVYFASAKARGAL